jgi:ppGpp synthetase/RelA/SpoT-type nucleotidyltranferase
MENQRENYYKEYKNYRSALEEIHLILDELKQQYDYMTDYSEIKEIQDKINEVLDESN